MNPVQAKMLTFCTTPGVALEDVRRKLLTELVEQDFFCSLRVRGRSEADLAQYLSNWEGRTVPWVLMMIRDQVLDRPTIVRVTVDLVVKGNYGPEDHDTTGALIERMFSSGTNLTPGEFRHGGKKNCFTQSAKVVAVTSRKGQ